MKSHMAFFAEKWSRQEAWGKAPGFFPVRFPDGEASPDQSEDILEL